MNGPGNFFTLLHIHYIQHSPMNQFALEIVIMKINFQVLLCFLIRRRAFMILSWQLSKEALNVIIQWQFFHLVFYYHQKFRSVSLGRHGYLKISLSEIYFLLVYICKTLITHNLFCTEKKYLFYIHLVLQQVLANILALFYSEYNISQLDLSYKVVCIISKSEIL